MKIVFFLPSLARRGGVERMVTALANALISHFGYEITILTCFGTVGESIYPLHPQIKQAGLCVSAYPQNPVKRIFWYISLIKPLSKWLKENENNVLMAEGSYLASTICFLHNKQIIKIGCEHISYRAVNPAQRLLRRLLYHRLDHVVVLTQNDSINFSSWFPRVSAIPNFIEPPIRHKASLASKIIISTGRLVKQKGYDLLLQASVGVFNAYPDWRLVILGEGQERKNLEELTDKLNLENYVSFPGEFEDVLQELSKASLFVIPSRYEGFPISLLEGISLGLPCVGFNVSGVDTLVVHEHNGLLAEAENTAQLSEHIIRLLQNAEERIQFGTNSAEMAERFSVQSVTEQWKTVLQSLLLS